VITCGFLFCKVNFILRAGAPIERHGTKVYTRSLFERFCRELFRSAAFSCHEGCGVSNYVVAYARASPHTDAGRRRFDVVCNPEKDEYLCVEQSLFLPPKLFTWLIFPP
jgi:hypothetical protein